MTFSEGPKAPMSNEEMMAFIVSTIDVQFKSVREDIARLESDVRTAKYDILRAVVVHEVPAKCSG